MGSYVAAVLGVVGLMLAPNLAIVWAFLIAFGLAKLPWQLWQRRWGGQEDDRR